MGAGCRQHTCRTFCSCAAGFARPASSYSFSVHALAVIGTYRSGKRSDEVRA
jgi:hypothetical protein